MDIPRKKSVTRNRRLRFIGMGVIGALCILVITIGLARLKPASLSVDRSGVWIDTVKRGSMLRQVRGIGTLVPEQIRWIPAPSEGRVVNVLVKPGMDVTPGTVLVEMVNPELAQEAQDAEFLVKAAEADLANLRVKLQNDRMTLQSSTAGVQSEYSQSKLQLDTDEALAKEGLVPELNLRLSRVKVQELANRLKIEQQRLNIGQQAVMAQIAAQQARIDQSRALSQLRRSQLSALRVIADSVGVVQEVSVQVGQQVVPGNNLARVADPTSLKAELRINETQVKDIVVGQPVSVDTRNGIVPGTVSRIDPSVREGTVTIDVIPTGPLPQGARPDLSVEGTIELERLTDVLHVGRPAFGQAQSTVGMFRLDPGGQTATRVQVRFGRSSVNAVEILDGLREGDQVILSDTSAWENQDRISLK